MKINDIVKLNIDDLGINGEGIAHFENKTVFVPFALPNETVEVKIISAKNNFFNAELINIIKSSTQRTTPLCPYFQKCGGCELQHLNYESQLQFKTNLVKNTLLKVGKIDFKVNDCVPSENLYYYRNKIAFPVVFENGKTKIGMFEKNSHNIVEIDNCVLQNNIIKKIIEIMNNYILKYNIKGYDYLNNNGILKHIVARYVNNTLLLTLVLTENIISGLSYLIEKLQQNFEKFGLNVNINTSKTEILSNNIKHIFGIEELELQEHNLTYNINTISFLQVNDKIKNQIYDAVLKNIDDDCTVIDAYCGAGLLTALCSQKCKEAVGIEIVKKAVDNAKMLFKKNKINNATALCEDCAKILPKLKINGKTNIVIDPPRNGCENSVLTSILKFNPNKIIYISCSPQTLARDLKILLAGNNYFIKSIRPYDMFPQTKHVETIVVLVKQ